MAALLKTVHVGSISSGVEPLCTVLRGSRHEVMYALNTWIFDYCYGSREPIQQLPPLDDWTRSDEDVSCWTFPILLKSHEYTCLIRSELVEFKV